MRYLVEQYGAGGGEGRDSADAGRQFAILAFPSDDFRQESGSDAEIRDFVRDIMGDEAADGPSFHLFAKSSLSDNPVFSGIRRQLAEEGVDGVVRGNFFKFLVDQDGIARMTFGKKEEPLSFESKIRRMIRDDA